MKEEIILIHISGEDRTGLTTALTEVMAQHGVEILDIGQAVIHDTLSLGILTRIPPESESNPVLKDLLFAAHGMGVNLKFIPISLEDYERWRTAQGKKRHIVTIIGTRISARHISAISKVLSGNGLNIDFIHRLSGRPSLAKDQHEQRACIELSVRGTPTDMDSVRQQFLDIAAELGVDIALQEDSVFRRNRRLVVFDMDSTLIQAEGIDELAARAGVEHEVSAITAAAMRGEMDFTESLRRRLALLEGLDESALEETARDIPLTEGAERLIANLKRFGYKIAIVSGGFTYFGRKLQDSLGIDYLYANELEIVDGKLTGRVVGDIVDGPRKAAILQEIAQSEEIDLQQTIAVGDGANDLPMLSIAGLGIAFHAKPKVKQGARQAISTLGLDSILYLIGVRDRDTVS